MTPRTAFRWTLIAAVVAAVFVGATWALGRLSSQAAAPRPTPAPVMDANAFAMQLDPAGLGTQTISGTRFLVQVSPYPIAAGRPISIVLIATALDGSGFRSVSPTLYITPPNTQNSADIRQSGLPRDAHGAYAQGGLLLDKPGLWRLRIDTDLGDRDIYPILLNLAVGQ